MEINLWVEKKYMNQNINDTKPRRGENGNGIVETKITSKNVEWNDISVIKKWKRNCPNCKSTLIYKNYGTFWEAKKYNSSCRSCSKLGNTGRKGQKNSEDHCRKIGLKHRGKKITDEAKLKMREAALRRIRLSGSRPYTNYNPIACKYFDSLNEKNGWNLVHALNGGEIQILGYSIDAYDKENNIIVEYDEPRHEKPSVKRKDFIRQSRLVNHLKCKFYRFSEKLNKLSEV